MIGLALFPPELVLHVCKYIRHPDLATMAQLSKPFGRVITPLLYTSITLGHGAYDFEFGGNAYLCCRTLATSEHDLADLVTSFSMDFRQLPAENWEGIDYLVCSIERMRNLKRYCCLACFGFLPKICIALSTKTHLRSIVAYSVGSIPISSPPLDASLLDNIRPVFPRLTEFVFFYDQCGSSSLPASYFAFISHIVKVHLHQLQTLGIRTQHKDTKFRGLFNKILASISIASSIGGIQVNNLRSLTIARGTTSLPFISRKVTFPNLRFFSGPSKLFKDMLVAAPRITTVSLDGSFMESILFGDRFIDFNYRPWQELVPVIKQDIPRSTIRDLSIAIYQLNLYDLPDTIPHLGSLERLMICIDVFPKHVAALPGLGSTWLSGMSSLHTLIICRNNRDFYRPKNFKVTKQMDILDTWKLNCPSLRTVVFNADYAWHRVGDSWASSRWDGRSIV